MDRIAHRFASGLILGAVAVLLVGCGSGTGGFLGAATPAAADGPGAGLNNDDPTAAPVAVAWTAARAQRCGFYFDPAKLRSSYLGYEARQSNTEQLAKAEKSYDSTYKAIREK